MRENNYDGLMGFSQGGIMVRHYLRVAGIIDPQSF